MSNQALIDELLGSIGLHRQLTEDTAHAEIHGNSLLNVHLVDGLSMDTEEKPDGIAATIRVHEGYKLTEPVHLCFGMIPESGIQRIELEVTIEDGAEASFLAHCTFPNAVDVQHLMNAEIRVGKHAAYRYFERHVHGPEGGITVVPKAKVFLDESARFSTEFALLKGRVGSIDIDYETTCMAHSVMEMKARISARGDDRVKIRESAALNGEYARGALVSHIAVRDRASAEIYNDLVARAPFARGHVDCKEIVQGEASARAIPIVQVNHPQAHVTHEAAIGSVDSRQLQTLMSRGLTEEEAVELIIDGLLS
jgi:uncharacterized protein